MYVVFERKTQFFLYMAFNFLVCDFYRSLGFKEEILHSVIITRDALS